MRIGYTNLLSIHFLVPVSVNFVRVVIKFLEFTISYLSSFLIRKNEGRIDCGLITRFAI